MGELTHGKAIHCCTPGFAYCPACWLMQVRGLVEGQQLAQKRVELTLEAAREDELRHEEETAALQQRLEAAESLAARVGAWGGMGRRLQQARTDGGPCFYNWVPKVGLLQLGGWRGCLHS
jgi:hypothetical protein